LSFLKSRYFCVWEFAACKDWLTGGEGGAKGRQLVARSRTGWT